MAQPHSTAARPFSRLVLRSALPLGLFFIIFGAKLSVIGKFGSDLPFGDQWDGEARTVYLPCFEGRLTPASFFTPHNEHRIVFTRLLNLGLLLWNGQWDARLQCVVNAALHGAILVFLLVWSRRHLGPWAAVAAFLLLIDVAAPPVVWENTLRGFHSQFYFLLGFSLAAMWLLLASPAWSWRWWLAVACALAAVFSMGSGFFCVLPVLALLASRLWFDRAGWRAQLPTVSLCCVVAGIGWMLRTDVPEHIPLYAHSLHDFSIAFLHSAAWPRIKNMPLAPLAYLPLGILCWQWWRRKGAVETAHQFVLAGGLWALLQTAATAYARGADGALPVNRYGDVAAAGMIFNGLALVLFFKEPLHGRGLRRLLYVLAGAWCAALITGVWFRAHVAFKAELPSIRHWSQTAEMNVQTYLRTGRFVDSDPLSLPYPKADRLASMLDLPSIRAILPASVRLPLAVEDAAAPNSSFVSGAVSPATPPLAHRKTWGSFTAGGRAAQGTWRSLPLPATRGGFWRFEIAGDLGQPGLSLQLVSASTGAVIAGIKPAKFPGDAWYTVNIRAPRETSVLVARDASPAGWFAFSEPVEMATGSWIAAKLAQSASWFLAAGCALGLAGIAATLKR